MLTSGRLDGVPTTVEGSNMRSSEMATGELGGNRARLAYRREARARGVQDVEEARPQAAEGSTALQKYGRE